MNDEKEMLSLDMVRIQRLNKPLAVNSVCMNMK